MNESMLHMWIQYTHLEKLYGYLPGMSGSIPGIFEMEPEQYQEIRGRFDDRARDAARDLLAEPTVVAQVDALPFRAGQKVLAVGDSITDDLQSWVEILRHLLDQRRADDRIQIFNGGLSAHTTAMVLRRWPATLNSRPDWIVCALGGNDVTRVGPEPTKPQVSLDESVANLRELRRIAEARTDASWVWMTPVPVVEERVAAYPAFRFGESTWRNSDIAALTAAMRGFDDPVVDLSDTFGVPARPELQGPDGLHVNIDGQVAIVTALLERLTREQEHS